MLAAVTLVLVLAQSPRVTPPANQAPIGFTAALEPLHLDGVTIAWQGPNDRLVWVDRRRFFDPGRRCTAEWSDTATQLTNLTLELRSVPVSEVKLAVGRTSTNGLTLGVLALAQALTRRRGREAAPDVFR